MFKKWKACGIGYDKRCSKMSLTFYNNGYTYYAFDMDKDQFDRFYESNEWENYKLPLRIRNLVKNCTHSLIYYWGTDGKLATTYCSKCNYKGFVDNRTKEDFDKMWEKAYKNEAKTNVIEAKEKYEHLLRDYIEKYNEHPLVVVEEE